MRLLIGLSLGIFLTSIYFILNPIKETISCSPIVMNNTIEKIVYQEVPIKEIPQYELIAENISNSHAYDNSHGDINLNYNCWDFSTDLKKALVNNSYLAEISCGFYKGQSHAWVTLKIPIEATTGEVVPMDVYKKDYSGGYQCSEKFRG